MNISYFHPIGELRYTMNGTSVVAHDCVAYKDVGQWREQDAVSFITPWNSALFRVVMSCPTPPQTHSSWCPTEDSRIIRLISVHGK